MVMSFIISSFFSILFHTKYIMTPLNLPIIFFLPVRTRHFFLSKLKNELNFQVTLGFNHRPARLELTK